jgi:L-lactate permease
MTHDLLHGDVAAAVSDNVFLLVGLPLLALWFAVRWRLGRRLMPIAAIAVLVVTVTAWTVVRNLPGFPLVPTLLDG